MSVSAIAFLVFGIIVAVFVVVFRAQAKQQRQVQQNAEHLMDRALAAFPEYRGKPVVMGDSLVLLIDDAKQATLVANAAGQAKEIPFSDFEAIEILEDGFSVAQTRKTGTIGRAAVGGLVAGGVGAVIGAVSAGSETTQREVVTNITVQVTTKDTSFPQLSWCTFAAQAFVENMNKTEVDLARAAARQFAQQFTPIFEPNAKQDHKLVSI